MPIVHISARLAPLPPSSSFIFPSPSAVFPPKKYTCLGMIVPGLRGPRCDDHETVGTEGAGGKGGPTARLRWVTDKSPKGHLPVMTSPPPAAYYPPTVARGS